MKYRAIFVFFLISFSSFSQFWFLGQEGKKANPNIKWKPNSSFDLAIGPSNYIGDVNIWPSYKSFALKSANLSFSGNFERHIKKAISLRLGLSFLRISGSDNLLYNTSYLANYNRNLAFRTNIKEFSLLGIYNLDLFGLSADTRPKFYPYIGAGIAAINFTPYGKDYYNFRDFGMSSRASIWQNLTTIPNEIIPYPHNYSVSNSYTDLKYDRLALAIPVVLGMNFQINNRFFLGFEFNLRKSLTDNLDDVPDDKNFQAINSKYSNQNLVNPSNQDKIFVQKGKDWYFSTQLKLIYHIPNKFGETNCPIIFK